MTVKGREVRLGLARVLVLVGLLAGVFAMHGLTSRHDAGMAVQHAAAAHHVEAVTVAITTPDDSGHHHATDLCLAVLTVLALAFLAVLALPAVAFGRVPGERAAPVWLFDRPWAQPSLSKLCVLRT